MKKHIKTDLAEALEENLNQQEITKAFLADYYALKEKNKELKEENEELKEENKELKGENKGLKEEVENEEKINAKVTGLYNDCIKALRTIGIEMLNDGRIMVYCDMFSKKDDGYDDVKKIIGYGYCWYKFYSQDGAKWAHDDDEREEEDPT